MMVLKTDETVFGSRHAKKLKVGDLVSWNEWSWESQDIWGANGEEKLCNRQVTHLGVISEIYVEDRQIRKVAMAKVVPMNTKTNKRVYERPILVTSLKLVSRGNPINADENNRGGGE